MRFYDDDLIDELATWEEVQATLLDEWYQVRDRSTRLLLAREGPLLLVDEPRSGSAAQRRLLHRSGFRRAGDRHWTWRPPEPVLSGPPWAGPDAPPAVREALERGRRRLARDRTLREMALRVLRDVYRCSPTDLEVWVCVEVDDWGEEDDWDDDDLPPLTCAQLEARYGRGGSR